MEDKINGRVELYKELYADLIARGKESLENEKDEWLRGFYTGKIQAYEFALEDLKRLEIWLKISEGDVDD